MKLFPAIDIMGGEVVRLERGEAETATAYHSDPVAQAEAFAAQGASYLHVVDLDAAFRSGHNRPLLARIAGSTALRVQVGGGIRELADVEMLLEEGMWRIVIGSAAVQDPALVAEAVKRHPDRIAVGLDAEEGRLKIVGWTEAVGLTAREAAKQMAELGVRTLVYTDIARDGMLRSPDIEGALELARHSGCRVVVSGGVSSLDDLSAVATHPERERIDGVIVGKALYEGRVELAEALRVLGEAAPC